MRSRFAPAGIVILAAACTSPATGLSSAQPCHLSGVPVQDTSQVPGEAIFHYDRRQPLDLQDRLLGVRGGIEIREISFHSPDGGRATGHLTLPTGDGPFPAILVQHGMPSRSSEMLPDALVLSQHGAVVLALDAPFARRQGMPVRFTEEDSVEQVQLMIDLQRAVDLLLERPDVDPTRIGYFGFSYGAAMGTLFAGIERRLVTYILAAGDGGLVSHFTGPDDRDGPLSRLNCRNVQRWIGAMLPIEPMRFIHRAPPAPIFFQAARRDEAVPAVDAERLHAAAREPKAVQWYESGHFLPNAAVVDRLRWFHLHLGTRTPAGHGSDGF